MTYQKYLILFMCRDSNSLGFFHTPRWRAARPASIEKSLTCYGGYARPMAHKDPERCREAGVLRKATRRFARKPPGSGGSLESLPARRPSPFTPHPTPAFCSVGRSLGEVHAHFLENRSSSVHRQLVMVRLEVRISRVHDAFFPTARFPGHGQEAAATLRGWFRSEIGCRLERFV
jgi:hypothetical protein